MMRQAAEQLAASVRISDLEKELQMAREASAKAGWCGYLGQLAGWMLHNYITFVLGFLANQLIRSV